MVKNIGMKKNIRSGYFTVDAAIFLPVFLIAMLTLAFFIKVVGSVEIEKRSNWIKVKESVSRLLSPIL